MSSELFKEAIADAKAVRASALANAKASLEEAFAPRMARLMAEKLKEELGEEEGTDEEEGTEIPLAPDPVAAEGEEITSEDIDAILAELNKDINEEDVPPASDAPVDASVPAPAAPVPPVPGAPIDPATVQTVAAPVMVVAPDQLPGAQGAPVPPPSAPPTDVPPPVDADLNLEAMIASLNEEEEEKKDDDDEEIDLNELLSSLSENSDEKEEKDEEKEKELEETKKQFAEACETIEFLRSQLNEVNLLNAKLLYTNKLFKAHAFDNSQKMKIIEAFDLTKSVREVKLTYNNLSEAFNLSKVKKAPSQKTTIAEGFASQSTGTTKPAEKIVSAPINETVSRFQKLAGIKK